MIDREVIEATKARFAERSAERTMIQERLEKGDSPLQIDTTERAAMRVERLSAAARLEPGPREGTTEVSLEQAPDSSALERIIGNSNLLPINFLGIGQEFSRSVGRIRLMEKGRTVGFGTGFLVSPRLLLTNNHVLHSTTEASSANVEFNYQVGVDGRFGPIVSFTLQPELFFLTDQNLDYSLVAVNPVSLDQQSLSQFEGIRLIEDEGKIVIGEFVNIVQHPNGEPKQVAVQENQVIDILPDFVHYQTDTAPGSSGSAVANNQWEVVALHHSGVPREDAQGHWLTKNGTLWKESMGEDAIDWIANEGVRVSRIIAHIKAQPLNDAQQQFVKEMFTMPNQTNAASTTPPQEQMNAAVNLGGSVPTDSATTNTANTTVPNPVGTVAPTVSVEGGGNTVTFTIPVQITVHIGTPIMQNVSPVAPVAITGKNEQTAPLAIAPVAPSTSFIVSATSSGRSDSAVPYPNIQDEPTALHEALHELEVSRTRTYYDETSDSQSRDTYYKAINAAAAPADLYSQLSELVRQTHKNALPYQPSAHVYPWVDMQEDGKIRSIYSGRSVDPAEFIRGDFKIEQERMVLAEKFTQEVSSPISLQEQESLLESSLPYNCEHVVPQSWFNKRLPMRGDLHHLFGCETHCNSFRGNTPYFDFGRTEEKILEDCGEREEGKFEPRGGKGAVARATLYFLLRYPGEINRGTHEYTEDRIALLLRWHKTEPVGRYELHRNAAIFEKQGNRNPLIDHPEWAEKIDFLRGLGS